MGNNQQVRRIPTLIKKPERCSIKSNGRAEAKLIQFEKMNYQFTQKKSYKVASIILMRGYLARQRLERGDKNALRLTFGKQRMERI